MLPLLLEAHPGQGVGAEGRKVLRTHPHQEAAVDVLPVPGPVAHAVGHHLPRGGGGGHHLSPGAHAEGEGGPAGGQVAGQLVVRGGQLLPGVSVLGPGDGGLVLLNAHPDGEGLLLHRHPRPVEHGKGVPGGVSRGQHQGAAVQAVRPLGALHAHAGEHPLPGLQAGELMAEAHVAPQGDELLADALHHLPQNVGANVGLVGPLHVRRGPRPHQGVHHRRDAGVVGAGGQLPVGESARAPLPELYVGSGVQRSSGPEPLYLGGAGVHVLAPLQHHAGDAVPGQKQGGKEPRRSHPHHHGHGPRAALHLREHIGLGGYQGDVFLSGPLHRLLLPAFQGYVHGVHVVHVLLLPGVDGLPDQDKVLNRPGAHPKGLARPPA